MLTAINGDASSFVGHSWHEPVLRRPSAGRDGPSFRLSLDNTLMFDIQGCILVAIMLVVTTRTRPISCWSWKLIQFVMTAWTSLTARKPLISLDMVFTAGLRCLFSFFQPHAPSTIAYMLLCLASLWLFHICVTVKVATTIAWFSSTSFFVTLCRQSFLEWETLSWHCTSHHLALALFFDPFVFLLKDFCVRFKWRQNMRRLVSPP